MSRKSSSSSFGIAAFTAAVIALVAPRALAAQQPDGRALYLKNCRQCHGATGTPSATNKAKYPKIRDLRNPAVMASIPEDSVMHAIKHGRGKDMRPFEGKLKDDEMHAIAQYVRTLSATVKVKKDG